MEKTGIDTHSRDMVLREMEAWLKKDCNMLDDYDTLWQMFRTVISTSSYGTSEYGGPVWLMDFSLANLMQFFPDNPWLEAMNKEWEQGTGYNGVAKSSRLIKFSEWFEYRAQQLIERLGLGNVLVKTETAYEGNLTFYGYGIFLDVLRSLVGGRVERICHDTMLKYNFSYAESEAVIHGMYPTRLKSSSMAKQFPYGVTTGAHHFKHSDIYGDCYLLEHFSLTKGYVIPETIREKFLILIVNDLMECKAQGHGNKPDQYGYTVPYPQMKFEKRFDICRSSDQHFLPTSNTFFWHRRDSKTEEITVTLPKIKLENNEFWHWQFPLKQNWRVLPEK